MFRDAAHVRRVVDGPIGNDLKAKFAAQNFMVQGFINYGARHLLTKEAVTKPSQSAESVSASFKARCTPNCGKHSAPTRRRSRSPRPTTRCRPASSTMMDLTKSAYAGFKLYEVVPYLNETAHIWATGVVYFSAPFWKSLKDNEKAVFSAAAAEGALYFDQLIVEDEKTSMERAAAAGGKTIAIEDRPAWEKGARGVWAALAPKVGGIDKIEAIVKTS